MKEVGDTAEEIERSIKASAGEKIDIEEVTWNNLSSNDQAVWRRRALDAKIIIEGPTPPNTYESDKDIESKNQKVIKFYEENKNTDSNITLDTIPFSFILELLASLGVDLSIEGSDVDVIQTVQTVEGVINTPPPSESTPPSIPPFPSKIKLIKVKGTIVDQITNEPLKGVIVTGPLKNIKRTNRKGEFNLKVPSLIDTEGEIYTGLNPTLFPITTLKSQYSVIKIVPYSSTGEVKEDLGIIKLSPKISNLQKEINKLLALKDKEVEEYTTKYTTFEFTAEKKLNNVVDNLKKSVIPLILTLLAQYGLSKIQELIEENKGEITEELKVLITCPISDSLPDPLVEIIKTKNKLVKIINQSLQTIKTTSDTLQISDETITAVDKVYQVLKILPVPTAVAGVGIPIFVINNIQDTKNFLNKNIGKYQGAIGGLSSIMSILISVLEEVLGFLNLLDKVTQYCTLETNNTNDISQNAISQELTALTQNQAEQLSPVITNVNGFTMGVETEITENSLKRRRATATNTQGVVLLRGEYSFSSIDQILIDELVFYIQTNNLKAD